jgi:LysR family transcriptional regulator, glycine cleavage system transcriptional activator
MSSKIDLRKLPPLKSLKGFEAATRHQSIREAADELCLTHPAVSHQVQLIEEALGVALFAQEGRRIVSTEEGRVLYPYVRAAFESLIEGVEAARRHALDKPLRVQTYVTASIRWLAKRVPMFLADNPNVKLILSTCAVEWEFDDVNADVGLVYCETAPDHRYHWTPLFEYSLFPVCSPAMAASLGPNPGVADLLEKPLIVINTEVRNWQTWFESAGISFDPARTYMSVDTLAVALEMALNGEAIALVNGPFVDSDLAAGRLVRPVAHKAVCPGEWGLICRKDMKDNVRIRTFIDWVSANAARTTVAVAA